LADLEQLIARIQQAWQAMNMRVDALATATADAQKAASAAKDAASGAAQTVLPAPPTIDAPTNSQPADTIGSAIEKVAEPWISAKLAAFLVSVGVPGGIAGVAAGAVVWLVMRRARQRLQGELDRVKDTSADAAAPGGDSADSAVRHHNQYVAYETSALDKAWAAAHAHVGERYPGAVPYLKLVEGVKDQLISGNNDPQLS
jgi:hypothetical protein